MRVASLAQFLALLAPALCDEPATHSSLLTSLFAQLGDGGFYPTGPAPLPVHTTTQAPDLAPAPHPTLVPAPEPIPLVPALGAPAPTPMAPDPFLMALQPATSADAEVIGRCIASEVFVLRGVLLQNNILATSAGGGTALQCLLYGRGVLGWEWAFSGCASPQAYSYPVAIVGRSTRIKGVAPTTPLLGKQVGQYDVLDLTYSLQMLETFGSYGLVIKGYATRTPGGKVAMELTWYLLHQNVGYEYGETMWEEVETRGRLWDAFMGPSRLAFVPREPPCAAVPGGMECEETLDVAAFLQFAYQRGFVESDHWLEGLELGTEVWGDCSEGGLGMGSGKVLVSTFRVATTPSDGVPLVVAPTGARAPVPIGAPTPGVASGFDQLIGCTAFQAVAVGDAVYENNVWGIDKAQGVVEQCLVERAADGAVGWTWQWEGCDDSIYAYPEVIVGAKPWVAMENTHPGLVATVGGYEELTVELHTETVDYAGSFNLALEGWTTSKRYTGTIISDFITTEVMWVIHLENYIPGSGKALPLGNYTQDGIDWDVLVLDRTEPGAPEWDFYIFAPQNNTLCTTNAADKLTCKVSINKKAYLDWLVKKEYINPDDWYQAVELGNEIAGDCAPLQNRGVGIGTTLVVDLNVTAVPIGGIPPAPPAFVAPNGYSFLEMCGVHSMVEVGDAVFENNVWGIDKAQGVANQCLVERVADGVVGWMWQWEGCDDSIYAYPEAIVGAKPWVEMVNTHPGLVATVGGYEELTVVLHTETVDHAGSFNLALEGWTTSRRNSGKQISDSITAEVMWVIHLENYIPGSGKALPLGNYTQDGIDWDVLVLNRTEPSAPEWDFYIFAPQNNTLCTTNVAGKLTCKASINKKAYLDWLVKKEYLNPDDWYQVVELGNEIAGDCKPLQNQGLGVGLTVVVDLNVTAVPTGGIPPPPPKFVTPKGFSFLSSSCRDFATVTTGNAVYQNNVWGIDKAQGVANQCLVERVADGVIGWTWQWEGCDDSIYAYPEVIVGAKPWMEMENTHPGLVATVGGYEELSVVLNTETVEYAGSFNLALEGWTTSRRHVGRVVSSFITAEVMWVIHLENYIPGGGKALPLGNYTQDGIDWDVLLLDRTEPSAPEWDFYIFTPKSGTLCSTSTAGKLTCKVTINKKAYLDWMVTKEYLSPDDYYQAVELGNEIAGDCAPLKNQGFGIGTTVVVDLNVTAVPTGGVPPPPPPFTAPSGHAFLAKCAPFSIVTVEDAVFENNIWGIDKAQGVSNQCLVERLADGAVGWTWQWEGCDDSIYAYPEIIVGGKPWVEMVNTHPGLAATVGGYDELTVELHTETINYAGSFNLALEGWTTSVEYVGEIVSDYITAEVMWVIHLENYIPGSGKALQLGSYTQDGIDWDVLVLDRTEPGVPEWDFYIFAPKDGSLCTTNAAGKLTCKASINKKAYLDWLVKKEYINPDDWYQAVELGNEIAGDCKPLQNDGIGIGTTVVVQFDVTATPAGTPPTTTVLPTAPAITPTIASAPVIAPTVTSATTPALAPTPTISGVRVFKPAEASATEHVALTPVGNGLTQVGTCAHQEYYGVGKTFYENNMWGLGKVQEGARAGQCLVAKGESLGWQWEFEGCEYTVFAYPEVMVGYKPWYNMASSMPALSATLGSFTSLTVEYDLLTTGYQGTFNLALEGWVTAKERKGTPNVQTDIRSELMWYLYSQQGASPAGELVESVEIAGEMWDLYVAESTENVAWDFYTFKPQVGPCKLLVDGLQCSGKLDLVPFLEYVVAQGHIPATHWLQGLELGNEVFGNCGEAAGPGKGTTLVSTFEVTVETA